MTVGVRVLENDGRVQITATGGETSLAFDFLITSSNHIRIVRTRSGVDTTLAITTDYTVPGGSINVETGGTVTLTSPATAGDRYTLLLDVPYERTTDFNPNGDFLADTLNLELDLLAQQNQQIVRDLSLTMKLPESTTLSNVTLPSAEANKLIGWNGSANGLSNYGAADLSASVVSSFAQTFLDDTSATAVQATLDVLPQTRASSSTSAYIDFAEDTDNGTNRVRVIAPASLAADVTSTLPGNTGTLLSTGATVTVAQGGTGLATLTANNLLVGNGTGNVTFVAPGTSGNVLTSNGTVWQSAAKTLPTAFTSTEISLVSGTDNSQAHGLGTTPSLVRGFLRCKTAELGYSVGDEVSVIADGNPANATSTVYANATNVGVTVFNSIAISRRNAPIGDSTTITYANWRYVLRAWA
jgi:hypothetical protein